MDATRRGAARRAGARAGLAAVRVLVVLAVAALGGCEWVFPPFTLADDAGGGGGDGGDDGGGDNACAEGSCLCSGAGTCSRSCPAGGCRFVCSGSARCTFSCAGGGCTATGTGSGDVALSCLGGSCTAECVSSGHCTITDCLGGGCVVR